MTELEIREHNWHWNQLSVMAQARPIALPKFGNFTKLWLWRWQRIRELEAEPYNPWTPGCMEARNGTIGEEHRKLGEAPGQGRGMVRAEVHLAGSAIGAGRSLREGRGGEVHRVQAGGRDADRRPVGGDRQATPSRSAR